MKIRPLFIYLGLFVVTVLLIVLFSGSPEKTADPHAGMNQGAIPDDDIHKGMNEGTMPDDDIHKGMSMGGNSAPGSGNVSSQFKDKIESLKTKIAENPDDTASVRIYAEMLASAHQSDKSVDLFKSILEKDPSRVDIMLTLSFIEYNRGKYEEAGNYTEKILKIEPLNAEAFYNKGAIEAAKGNKEKAKEIWQDLISKIPQTEAANLAKSSLQRL